MSKVDRRILKSQEAIKRAILELMTEKNFDQITIQDISDRANVSRKTIYLHYADKFDLLDKLIEESIDKLREVGEAACELDWKPATQVCFEYLESHYPFFSTMLANKGAPYFRSRFLKYQIEAFQNELRKTNDRKNAVNEEITVQLVASAYVGVVEWWLTNGMPHPPRVMADQVGTLFEALYE